MTAAEASAAGYRALTSPFHRKTEGALLDAVVADMERGGIVHELIETAPGRVEVWRKNWVEMPNPTQTVVRGIRGRRD